MMKQYAQNKPRLKRLTTKFIFLPFYYVPSITTILVFSANKKHRCEKHGKEKFKFNIRLIL